MALVFADRVRETTSTAGTGTFSLLGAVSSCQSFAAIGNGNTTYYTAVNQVGTEWEVGLGTYNAGTITRDTILSSSNGGAIVNFSAGTKDIFCDYPAGKAVLVDGSGNTYAPNIGGTTASAGTFTTGTLKGTGQNLAIQSNSFVTSWNNTAITVTGSQSDPFGGVTASLLVPTAVSSTHSIYNNPSNMASGAQFTVSIYVKASGYNLFFISDIGGGTYACSYDLTLVTATPFLGCTATITAVSGASGWYRLTLTTTGTPTSGSRFCITPYPSGTTLNAYSLTFTGNGTSGAFVYGAQVEFGATAGTYIPTTTSAVFGNPSLSFLGVAGIGLQSDGSLYVQPAGTGALQAQATTSTTAGGNARGANAVDWQTSRGAASQVANASFGTIGGGQSNTSSGYGGTVAGGIGNNSSSGYAFIGSGLENNARNGFSTIAGGFRNNAAGQYGFIGSGYSNTATSNAAVTTQSATMNATTTVTLSGSNAAIKVGQLINGTYILGYPNDTYVAAISGTTLTLSQAASGSGVATLSFYTPHGNIVGGGNNQATGSYSFIGGGGDAGTAASRNVASGDWSVVVGGRGNGATGISSFVGGGGTNGTNVTGNFATASYSAVVGGYNNQATGIGGFVGAGRANYSTGPNMAVIAGGDGNTSSSYYSGVLAGSGVQATQGYATAVGGAANIASGWYNFIGNGYGNSTNVNGYLTTATTTIALTASTTIYLTNNAGNLIRVGCIVPFLVSQTTLIPTATSGVTTTVASLGTGAAISGTTLTVGTGSTGTIVAGMVLTGGTVTAGTYIVSNIAGSGDGSTWVVSASQTSTVTTATSYTFTVTPAVTVAANSFVPVYTAYSAVVAGGNNQATGNYAFIGGGGDAGTAANRNVASGDWSTVAGGRTNQATGIASFIGGGGVYVGSPQTNFGHTASGSHSAIVGGLGNIASGESAFIGGGYGSIASNIYSTVGGGTINYANGIGSTIAGGYYGNARSVNGYTVFPACVTPIVQGSGVSQAGLLVLGRQTTDATATVLTSTTSAASTNNQVILPNNSAYYFKGSVIANVTGAANGAAWSFEGAIMRGANAASTVLIGTVTLNRIAATAGASLWTVALTADTTNGGLAVTVTGLAATTIRWVAKVETTEVTF